MEELNQYISYYLKESNMTIPELVESLREDGYVTPRGHDWTEANLRRYIKVNGLKKSKRKSSKKKAAKSKSTKKRVTAKKVVDMDLALDVLSSSLSKESKLKILEGIF